MPTELGAHNPRIERVRELRSARGRREQGCFAIEGPTLLAEAVGSGAAIREIYGVAEQLARQPVVADLERTGVPVFAVPPRAFARLSDLETPPGLLAVTGLPASDPAAIMARPGPVLLLAGINDPGNAGTLLRSAEAFGAAGALFGTGSVDPFAPKVVRAAMGALFRLPTATVDAQWLLAAAAQAERPVVAADTGGGDIENAGLPQHIVLAIGNERRGVRDWLPHWDQSVSLRQRGQAESLNAAVAGSILLYLLSRAGESCQ